MEMIENQLVPSGPAQPRGAAVGSVTSDGFPQPQWYAAYTCSNQEKRVAEHLGHRAIEHFLPQFESVRRWKDRRVRLQLPLFPGYVFVRIDFTHRLRVLQVPHVVRIVGFDGSPMPVPDEELIRIRALMASGCEAKPYPYLRVGRRVRVASGPFEGLEGIVVRRKNGMRLVISLEIIQRSIAVELSELELAPAASDFSGSSPLSRAHG